MITDTHVAYLTDHAITVETIDQVGITSSEDGSEIHFPWSDGDRLTVQRRPWPGEGGQYFWESGKDLHFWTLRDAGPDSPVLLVEGTKQSLAATSHAPAEYSVIGMAGCWGWSKEKLGRFRGRSVVLCLDADASSNLDVYEAGEKMGEKLKRYGVELKYVRLPGSGSMGLDDYLASLEEDERSEILAYEIDHAGTKPADKRPASRKRRMEMDLPDLGDRVGVAVNQDRKGVIDKITGAFKDRWDGHTLFNYGEILTRVRGHETQPLDRDRFLAMLADTAACFKYTEATDKRPALFDPCWPDPPTIGAVMSKAEEFSPLSRVVRIPFLRPDGTVCSAPGYDRETQTVLVPSGIDDVEVPSEPTQEQTRLAAKLIMDEWLGDLPFKTEADRSNALAMVLTPFIRGTVPLVPLGVVSGLQMGVGKNLFADCLSILATGQAAMPLPYVAQEEEMRKQITSAFASGAELFVFDEAHVVEGAQFARAITSLTYGDRILGVSRIAKFPNQVTWMALGNQVQVNGDMSRRVYFVYLHPSGRNVMDREAGSFRHPDLKLWTTENRSALVSAALTVLRGWWAAGRPSFSRGACMGSFEPWDRMMSGVLAHAGMPAFLTDMRERRSESDFTAAYWEAHVHWLHEMFGEEEFTTRQVQEAALKDPRKYEAAPGLDDATGKTFTRQLGQAYSKHRDRNYNGVILVKSGMGHKSTLKWRTVSDNGGREVTGGDGTTPRVWGNVSSDVRDVDTRVKDKAGAVPSPSLPTSEADPWDVPVPAHLSGLGVANAPETMGDLNALAETGQLVLDMTPLKFERESVDLGFDIETASADEMFRGRHEGPFVRLVGGEGGAGPVVCDDPSALVDDLNRAEVIYGHNILGFDLVALAQHHGADYDALAAKAVDTLTLAQLAWPSGAKGDREDYSLDAVAKRLGHTGKSGDLKALALEFCPEGETDAAGRKLTQKEREKVGYSRIPVNDESYRDYLRGDLAATHHVYESFEMLNADLPDHGLNDYARREMRVAAIQNRMTLNGWKVDTALLAERVAHEDHQRTSAAQQLAERFGMPLAPPDKIRLRKKERWPEEARETLSVAEVREWVGSDPQAVVDALLADRISQPPYAAPWATDAGRAALIEAFRSAGAEHYPTTASGQLALSSDALGEGNWYDKNAGKAKPGMLKVYGHIPEVRELCSLITQATGATAKYAEIAEWLSPAGRVHAEMSDVQASGRWATKHPATANADPKIRDVFVPDDGHVLITCDLSQVDMRAIAALSQCPDYMKLFQPGRDAHMEMAYAYFGERTDAARKKAKRLNHQINYGGGINAVSEQTGVPADEVARVFQARAEAYPRLIEWTGEVRAIGESGVLLDNGFGRLMKCDPERAYTQAPALMGQGAARDLMCEGLLRLVERDSAVTPYLRGVVHDEVILSVPAEEAEYWRDELETAFTFEWKSVPILCSVSNAGANWLECEH